MPTNNSVNYNLSGMTSTGIVKYDGTTLVSSSTAKIDSSNRTTNTSQPCFLAYLSANTAANVTGDGTTYQVAFDTVVFDQGSNFTTGASSVFTAPITGKYFFSAGIDFIPGATSTTSFFVRLAATSRTVETFLSYAVAPTSNVQNVVTCTAIIDMTANDTIKVQALALSGTKTTAIGGTGSPYLTYFSGYLVC